MAKVYAAKCPACDSNFSILEGEEVKCRICGYDRIETFPLESFEEERLKTDIERAKDPTKWPMRPLLPLVNRLDPKPKGGPAILGFLVEGQGSIVFIGCIDTIDYTTELSKLERIVFYDYESLFKSGWRID